MGLLGGFDLNQLWHLAWTDSGLCRVRGPRAAFSARFRKSPSLAMAGGETLSSSLSGGCQGHFGLSHNWLLAASDSHVQESEVAGKTPAPKPSLHFRQPSSGRRFARENPLNGLQKLPPLFACCAGSLAEGNQPSQINLPSFSWGCEPDPLPGLQLPGDTWAGRGPSG